jgi:signal transduction histidine kinase
VEGAQEAAIRATAIVTDMLAFSRRSDHRFAPVRIDEMLDRIVRLAASDYDLSKHYDFRQIDIVRRYDANLPPVLCNSTEIEQVLLNIVKNASEALASGATAPPQRITLRTLREGDYARIELEDNGPGMEEDIRARVFDPFFTTKPSGKGTGLGLSVAYFIICEQHRGTISVRSKPGAGTCFIIRLPVEGGADS